MMNIFLYCASTTADKEEHGILQTAVIGCMLSAGNMRIGRVFLLRAKCIVQV